MKFNTFNEAVQAFEEDAPSFEQYGAILGMDTRAYLPESFRHNFALAMDAQPSLMTSANSAVPAFLTTMIDPTIFEILFSPNKAAKIFGEAKKGTWLDDTAMFPTVEHTGEVSSYGDYAENGRAGANTNWPQRQAYLFQTIKEYGERELERAGLAKLNWVSEIDKGAATIMDKFQNVSYFYGIAGLQNYGLFNDPNLSASLTPATKSAGGTAWITGGVVVASANEIYTDIQSLFNQLVSQSGGLIEATDKLTLAMSPTSAVALTTTNSFNVNVHDLLKKNFPSMDIETAVQYGVRSASNPQGVVGGSLMQMFVDSVEGQDTGYCSFNEKMRAHPIVRNLSSFKQKVTGGTWGAIIRQPFGIAGMIGI